MTRFILSFILVSSFLKASEESINSTSSIIKEKISSNYSKYQLDIAATESLILEVDQNQTKIQDSLQNLNSSLLFATVNPVSLYYAVNLLETYKCLSSTFPEKNVVADELEQRINNLEQAGLSSRYFFCRPLTPSEFHDYEAIFDICQKHKRSVCDILNDSMLTADFQLKQLVNQKLMLQQKKDDLYSVASDYYDLMSNLESDVTSEESSYQSSDQAVEPYQEESVFVENNLDKGDMAQRIQSIYRMFYVKKMHKNHEVNKKMVNQLLDEVLIDVDVCINEINKKQQFAEAHKKNVEERVVYPILQSIIDKSFMLIDKHESDKLFQSQQAATKNSKKSLKNKKNKLKESLDSKLEKVGEVDFLDVLVAQNRAQEEFQNIWICALEEKIKVMLDCAQTDNKVYSTDDWCDAIATTIDELKLSRINSKNLASLLFKESVAINADLKKVNLSKYAEAPLSQVVGLQDRHERYMEFLFNQMKQNKIVLTDHESYHLKTLFFYLTSLVHQNFDIEVTK